jgi:alpha-tubulin suppressor-like RCC1 family protein
MLHQLKLIQFFSLMSIIQRVLSLCEIPCQPGTFGLSCTACDTSNLDPFEIWKSTGECRKTCRDGYSDIVNNTSTTVCYPIIDSAAYIRRSNSFIDDAWEPGMRQLGACLNPGNTGTECNVACPSGLLTCDKYQRPIPCLRPWKPFCAPCGELVPSNSDRVSLTVADAKWVQNFEDAEMYSVYWVYNANAGFMTTQYGASIDLVQYPTHNGALNSQIWLSNVRSITPNASRTLPNNAVMRFSVSKTFLGTTDVSAATLVFGSGVNEISITQSDTWMEVVVPLDTAGITVTGGGLVNIDEISIIHSLVTPYAGTGPSWCAAGLYRKDGVCMPCRMGYACPGVRYMNETIQCPSNSRPLPGSNTCICSPTFKTQFNISTGVYSCNACIKEESNKYRYGNSEDCSRGYAKGTLTAWQRTSTSPPNRLKQLSCGPLSCCAVDQVGDVLCWGDNTNLRLGSNMNTKPWAFARDALPVQGLHAPAVAVAVSQAIEAGPSDMSCALLEDGTVNCWGRFQLSAIDDTVLGKNTHTCTNMIENGSDDPLCGFKDQTHTAVILRVSSGTACVANEIDEIWCWGRDLWTGTGTEALPRTPRRWDNLLSLGNTGFPLVDFALAERFICAMYSGKVLCVGRKEKANFGITNIVSIREATLRPSHISISASFVVAKTVEISAAGNSLCSLWKNDAAAYDYVCEVYDTATTSLTVKFIEKSVGDGVTTGIISSIDTGASEGYAVFGCMSNKNTKKCFGASSNGNRMFLAGTATDTATEISALKLATTIALGNKHGCARFENGDVSCWGNGANGRLGNTTCLNVGTVLGDTPVLVSGLKLRSFEQQPTWSLSGGAVAYISSWKLPEGAAISHPLALLHFTRGRYITETPSKHWVHVHVTAECVTSNCKLVLAQNLDTSGTNAGEYRSTSIFHSEDIEAGQVIR